MSMETEASRAEAILPHAAERVFLSQGRGIPAVEPSHIRTRTLPYRPRSFGIADAFALACGGDLPKIATPVDEHVVYVHATASVEFAGKVEHHAQAPPTCTAKPPRRGGVERLRSPKKRHICLRHGLHQSAFFIGVENQCPSSGKRRPENGSMRVRTFHHDAAFP
ncbi:MAG: hypothetical protein Q4E80_04505 [Slackia faecicanis]|nr:hypothetical protein [Slackia faecicanis]